LETGTALFEAWTVAKRVSPDTAIYGPLLLRNVTLNGGATLVRAMSQNFPGTAPNGVYYFYANVGDYPNTVTDTDSFMINKGVLDEGGKSYINNWETTGWEGELITENVNPASFYLHPCSPNPFNASTVIRFELSRASSVEIKIFDIYGREIASIVNGQRSIGAHWELWDAGEAPSGIYFVRLTVKGFSQTQKLLLLK
jgi:hypothetical protein